MAARIVLTLAAALTTACPVFAQDPAAEPDTPPEEAAPRPERPRPRPAQPATSVVVANATATALTAVVLTGQGDTSALPRPVPPRGRATLSLPKRTGCTVAVQATFENGGFVDIPAFDVCKERTIRFTE